MCLVLFSCLRGTQVAAAFDYLSQHAEDGNEDVQYKVSFGPHRGAGYVGKCRRLLLLLFGFLP